MAAQRVSLHHIYYTTVMTTVSALTSGVNQPIEPLLICLCLLSSFVNRYIVSDCDSVGVLYENQHYTRTPEEAAADTIKAG